MNSEKNISAWQFAAFRILFGIYLTWHFVALIPYAPELFGNQGVLPQASLNLTYRAFPNLLALFDSPLQTQLFVGALAAIAISFTLGWHRRICALLLWYGWACLFNRNNLISNPGIPYVGLLLIYSAILPPVSKWKMPAFVYWGAWFLMAAGYTYSGVWKLISPSWQDGSALWHLLMNPLSRPGIFRDLLLALPWPVLSGLTWIALAGELLFLPLCLHRKGRFVAWTWMLMMHLGILLVVDFADLTLGVLMIHLFTFDPDWLKPLASRSAILLFDGDCAFCDRAVQFFSAEDANGALRFAPLKGKFAAGIVRRHRLDELDSLVFIQGERVFIYSDAVIRALIAIGGFWKLAAVVLIVPKALRDFVYRTFAARRHKFLRQNHECSLPTAQLRARLIKEA
jgi:predicted DCC family thiol-disulfide oxidoreductase YuxK